VSGKYGTKFGSPQIKKIIMSDPSPIKYLLSLPTPSSTLPLKVHYTIWREGGVGNYI
jgi:hypothetical protein